MKIYSKHEKAKRAAAQAASNLIQSGMQIGLGSGSTSSYFIEALGQRCQAGLKIVAIASSKQSDQLAKQMGIPLLEEQKVLSLDLTIDGADEIDPQKNMIKGGGGALLRERILACSSQEMIVIVDQSKCVSTLGHFPIPIEIAPFAYLTTLERLKKLGYQGQLRLDSDLNPFITDNHHYIVDIHLTHPLMDPLAEHLRLKSITGVIDTGLFIDIAKRVIIGYEDGNVAFQ